MPDLYARIAELDADTQERLANVLETRGADPQQQAMRSAFLSDPFGGRPRVLEVGCGTGVLTRRLSRWPGVGSVVAVDLAAVLLERARELARGLDNVTFQQADARALPFASESFDVVVFDSTLSHVPDAARSVAEASRVLRRQGWLAAFEGDYATTTVAVGNDDPLQACVDAMLATSVHDRWLVRRLPRLLRDSGLETPRLRGYSYVETGGEYLLSIVDRGADLLVAAGRIDRGLAESLSAEARRRVSAGTFFGHIAYASALARKPD